MATVNAPGMTDIQQLSAIKAEFTNRGRADLANVVQQKIAYLQSPAAAQGGEAAMPDALKQQMATVLTNMGVDSNGNIVGQPTAASVAQATALAGNLDTAGYPAAAAYLRQMAQRAGIAVPSLPVNQQAPIPCADAATQDKVNRALQMERDPAVLQSVVDTLKALPCASNPAVIALIGQFQALITNMQAANSTSQVLNNTGNIVNPTGVNPNTVSPKTPVEIAAETVVNNLNQVQATAGGNAKAAHGKENQSLVSKFQSLAGLTSDGKAGPGTVKALASVGHQCNLPQVMYWPQAANAQTVLAYRSDLNSIADTFQGINASCANALRSAASRERGTGGIVGSMPA